MGKNKKSEITIFDDIQNKTIELDSVEEWQFYNWVLEAKKLNLILEYEYQPESFLLSAKQTYSPLIQTKKKPEVKHLLADHVYSPDFKLVLNPVFSKELSQSFKLLSTQVDKNGNPFVVLDIKGNFQRFGGDRAFMVNVKWTFDKYGIFVQKIIPKDFFKTAGVPKRCQFTTKTNKPCKLFYGLNFIAKTFNIPEN